MSSLDNIPTNFTPSRTRRVRLREDVAVQLHGVVEFRIETARAWLKGDLPPSERAARRRDVRRLRELQRSVERALGYQLEYTTPPEK